MNVNTNVNKSKWAGIQVVKQYLEGRPHYDEQRWPNGKPKLFIFSTCTAMIKEIKAYRWKENQTGSREEPIKKNDHAMDDLRYYLMSKPEGYKASSDFVNPLLEHKKRLAKRLKKERMMR